MILRRRWVWVDGEHDGCTGLYEEAICEGGRMRRGAGFGSAAAAKESWGSTSRRATCRKPREDVRGWCRFVSGRSGVDSHLLWLAQAWAPARAAGPCVSPRGGSCREAHIAPTQNGSSPGWREGPGTVRGHDQGDPAGEIVDRPSMSFSSTASGPPVSFRARPLAWRCSCRFDVRG